MKLILNNEVLSIYGTFSTKFLIEVGRWSVYNDKQISSMYKNTFNIQNIDLEDISAFIKDLDIRKVKLEIIKDEK